MQACRRGMIRATGARLLATLLTVSAMALSGCAGERAKTQAPTPKEAVSPQAKRLYALAEASFADGDYEGALILWRQVFLQLPEGKQADALRHKLVERMTYGLTSGYVATGDEGLLVQAHQLLTRYLEKHEQLFGYGGDAIRERWELSAALNDVDRELMRVQAGERPPPTPAQLAARQRQTRADKLSGDEFTLDEGLESRFSVETPKPPNKTLKFLEKDSARRFFVHPGLNGGSLFSTPGKPLYGPRILVRMGIPKFADDGLTSDLRQSARARARASIKTVRPVVAACFTQAMGRVPRSWTKVDVNMVIQPDGSLERVYIAEGDLLDRRGNLCLLRALEGASSPTAGGPAQRVAVRVPLTVFFQPGAPYEDFSAFSRAAAGGLPNNSNTNPVAGESALDAGIENPCSVGASTRPSGTGYATSCQRTGAGPANTNPAARPRPGVLRSAPLPTATHSGRPRR